MSTSADTTCSSLRVPCTRTPVGRVGPHTLHAPLVEHARGVEDYLRSLAHQDPGGLREGGIVADRDADPAEVGVKGLQIVPGRDHVAVVYDLVGAVGLALFVHSTVRVEEEAGVVVASVGLIKVEVRAPDYVDPVFMRQVLEQVEV